MKTPTERATPAGYLRGEVVRQPERRHKDLSTKNTKGHEEGMQTGIKRMKSLRDQPYLPGYAVDAPGRGLLNGIATAIIPFYGTPGCSTGEARHLPA